MRIEWGETHSHEEENSYAKKFNRQMYDIIEMMHYTFYVIKVDPVLHCTCFDFDTKQGDSNCMKCLGTGHKIRITTATGSSMASTLGNSQREIRDVVIGNIYFIHKKYDLNKNDIVIDDDNVFKVVEKRKVKSFKGVHKYNKYLSVHLKHNKDIFLNNFFKILKEYRKRQIK